MNAHAMPPGPAPRRGLFDTVAYYRGMLEDSLGFVGDRFARYGDIYCVPNTDNPLYVLRHPDHFREVLLTNASSYSKTHSGLERLSAVLGEGLLTSDGETWKRHRRMVQPAFSKQRMQGYAETMQRETARSTAQWKVNQPMDVSRAMVELTMHVVSRALFTHDVSGSTDAVTEAMATLQSGVLSLALPPWVPNPLKGRMTRSIASLDALVHGMVRDRRAAVAAGKSVPSDLLQALVTAVDHEGDGGGLTEREVRDELVTLFLAGHETTSHALAWTWLLLAQNPRAEMLLHEELDRVLGGRAPGYDDLPKLVYTEQLFKESMRLYPPAYMLARRAHEDTRIGGYEVKKGSEVVLWIYHAHRDPRWFAQPLEFKPERFAQEEEAKLPKLAYMPFGAGARACIGKVFAMMEGSLILATIAQSYRFELARTQTVKVRTRVTLAPKGGLPMTLRER